MTLAEKQIEQLVQAGRNVEIAKSGDEDLGPLKLLPGVWKNTDALHGFGFNMIALPMADADPNRYRLLMNQYDEEIHFSIVDKGVPNRGINFGGETGQTDQIIVALDYDQKITQIAAEDSPPSGLTDKFNGKVIHREPGLWLHMTNRSTNELDVARLGTIPHGDSVLAVGRWREFDGAPEIPPVNGIVIGGGDDLTVEYFEPYKHFSDNPFKGSVPIDGFPGFEPVDTTLLLRSAVPGTVKRTTTLRVDSTNDHAGVRTHNQDGVVNIPFIVRQANAASMNCTFWIQEVEDSESGKTRLFLQYVQNVILDFFGRPDGHPGPARWPHISINTMEKVSDAKPESAKLEMLSK